MRNREREQERARERERVPGGKEGVVLGLFCNPDVWARGTAKQH